QIIFTTLTYTLLLHDALPIYEPAVAVIFYHADYLDIQALDPLAQWFLAGPELVHEAFIDQGEATVEFNVRVTNLTSAQDGDAERDRKSTRLNSSHDQFSYAVF